MASTYNMHIKDGESVKTTLRHWPDDSMYVLSIRTGQDDIAIFVHDLEQLRAIFQIPATVEKG